ncbi:MAG TPA: outer membrane beta-barrel protein [Chitinophagaceae bacterium]|nr:outer membrane beta-barrel protein [Chitinophagaceae bacterium]
MKKISMAVILLTISFVVVAQDTLPGNNKTAPKTRQKASTDFILHIDGIDGESGDSLPPAPAHLTLSAGGMLSQTTNSNLSERFAVQSRPGFIFSLGYTREFRKSRLQFNAAYQKGGVYVATGDIDGDGKDNRTNVDLNYLTIPVQYQVYLGKSKRFFLGGGGYASLLLSSKQTGLLVYDEGFKNYDAGCIASAGMWLGSRIMLQSGYHYGLANIDQSGNNKARNGMAFLMLNYSFYSKIKYGPIINIKPKG